MATPSAGSAREPSTAFGPWATGAAVCFVAFGCARSTTGVCRERNVTAMRALREQAPRALSAMVCSSVSGLASASAARGSDVASWLAVAGLAREWLAFGTVSVPVWPFAPAAWRLFLTPFFVWIRARALRISPGFIALANATQRESVQGVC
eukprot:1472405-Pleurochrysis_carterae.AAC.1